MLVYVDHKKIHAEDCDDCETKSAMIDVLERRIRVYGPLDDEQKNGCWRLRTGVRCTEH